MIHEKAVDEAIKKLQSHSPSKKPSKRGKPEKADNSTPDLAMGKGDLAKHLGEVRHAYGSLIGPEEEAQEGLLRIAAFPDSVQVSQSQVSPKPAPATSSSQGQGQSQNMQKTEQQKSLSVWADALAHACRAFNAHEHQFFTPWAAFGSGLDRCISLIQFVEDRPDQSDAAVAAGILGEEEAIENGQDNVTTEESVASSYLQFVHWDFASPPNMTGRRLRIEAGRFVWKPPSRRLQDDNLWHLFQAGRARAVIANVGVTLVKAKGQFRTEVPPEISRIVSVLTNATQGLVEGEEDKCFICAHLADSLCPTCSLWSHSECCDELVQSLRPLSHDTDGSESNYDHDSSLLASAVASTYMDLSCDSQGLFAASLVRFDDAERTNLEDGKALCSLRLLDSVCPLCRCIFRCSVLPKTNAYAKASAA